MEEESKTRTGNGGKRARADEDDGSRMATEDEVEEFFAILRRLHAASRHLGSGKHEGRQMTEMGARWKPSFEREDFEELNGVKSNDEMEVVKENGEREEEKGEEEEEEKKGENGVLGLDLNEEPEPEHPAHVSR